MTPLSSSVDLAKAIAAGHTVVFRKRPDPADRAFYAAVGRTFALFLGAVRAQPWVYCVAALGCLRRWDSSATAV